VTRVRRALLVCVLAVALGACSNGSSQTSPPTTTSPAAGPAPSGACPTFQGTMAPANSSGARPVGLLTDATAGESGCLDQVTFFFRSLGDGTPPGYAVDYQDPPFSIGDPPRQVTPDGSAFLSVTMTPAASVDVTRDDHRQTYAGSLLLEYGAHHHLVVVEKLDDSLASVHWVIALDEKRPFLVDSAVNPTRITVYIG
jgi:hypothetical protein